MKGEYVLIFVTGNEVSKIQEIGTYRTLSKKTTKIKSYTKTHSVFSSYF